VAGADAGAEALESSMGGPDEVHAQDTRAERRADLLREATIMVLYVSVVEIAELAGIPDARHSGHGVVDGPTDMQLLAIIWGTALGLAIAHWFAFGIAAPGIRGSRPSRRHIDVGMAQVGGAAFVAIISSLPILLLNRNTTLETIGEVPALIIGVIAYFIARSTGRPRVPSAFYALTALALGVVVALVKYKLAGTH
jgi:hypothetical protein